MKTNLIYLFADQWRAQAAGFAGQDPVYTPNVDSFSRESFCFSNAVSTYPLCSPHRAALMTGKYPLNCGMWTNCKTGLDETVMLKPQEITISDVLHQEGYQTAYIGKWHLDASEMNFYSKPVSGAEGWDAYTPPGERRHHFDYWFSYGAMDNHRTPHYWENDLIMHRKKKWSVEVETDAALHYLETRDRERPFCLFVSWNPPHPPYDQVPEKYLKLYEDKPLPCRENVPDSMRNSPEYQQKLRQYFAAVSGVDENFGRLMKYLKSTDLLRNTVVVLSSDHGDCMGSHGIYGKNIWYDESIRIPLLIGGGIITAGSSDALIASQDHMPTLLELLETEIPETVEGRSFAPLILGNEFTEPADAFLCMIPGMPELVEPYWKLGLSHKAFGWRGIYTKRYTYVEDRGTVPGEGRKRLLYDRKMDPFQMNPKMLNEEEAEKWSLRLSEYLAFQKNCI